MTAVDKIIRAKWIITCEDNNTVLDDHALIIQHERIIDILPFSKVAATYSANENIHYASHAVLPGFVNTHTHLAMNYLRGLGDDLALMDWLNNYIWPAEKKWVHEDFVYDASSLAMAEMIRSGTTCFNDMYFYLDATADAALKAGVRANIGITAIGFPTNWASHFEEYIQKGLAFYNKYKNEKLIRTTLAPHAIYTVSDEELIQIRDLAEKYDMKINMHIHETTDEINDSIKKAQSHPIRRLHEMGLITPRLIAVHVVHLDDEAYNILQQGKPSIVHCPESNMKLASGNCPVHRLRSLGLNVALGTDGAASNNDLDMISEMRTATLLAKLSTNNPTVLNASQTLTMATLNGAKALGLEQITGSLTKGKSADFIAIKLDEIETLPDYHPESNIVYAASRNQVTDTWVAGKQLMKNRELLTLDEGAIKASAQKWAKKLRT